MTMPKKVTPATIPKQMKMRPSTVCGEKSPKPTVEMVVKVKYI